MADQRQRPVRQQGIQCKRGLDLGVEHGFERFGCAVEQAAPGLKAGGVDHRVDRSALRQHLGQRGGHRRAIGAIGLQMENPARAMVQAVEPRALGRRQRRAAVEDQVEHIAGTLLGPARKLGGQQQSQFAEPAGDQHGMHPLQRQGLGGCVQAGGHQHRPEHPSVPVQPTAACRPAAELPPQAAHPAAVVADRGRQIDRHLDRAVRHHGADGTFDADPGFEVTALERVVGPTGQQYPVDGGRGGGHRFEQCDNRAAVGDPAAIIHAPQIEHPAAAVGAQQRLQSLLQLQRIFGRDAVMAIRIASVAAVGGNEDQLGLRTQLTDLTNQRLPQLRLAQQADQSLHPGPRRRLVDLLPLLRVGCHRRFGNRCRAVSDGGGRRVQPVPFSTEGIRRQVDACRMRAFAIETHPIECVPFFGAGEPQRRQLPRVAGGQGGFGRHAGRAEVGPRFTADPGLQLLLQLCRAVDHEQGPRRHCLAAGLQRVGQRGEIRRVLREMLQQPYSLRSQALRVARRQRHQHPFAPVGGERAPLAIRLQHDMSVGARESKGADAGPPRCALIRPVDALRVDHER